MKAKTCLGVTLGASVAVALAPYILSGAMSLFQSALYYSIVTPWRIAHMSSHVEVDEGYNASTRKYFTGATLTRDPAEVACAQRENMPRLRSEDGTVWVMANLVNENDKRLFNDGTITLSRSYGDKNGANMLVNTVDDHFDGSIDDLSIVVNNDGKRQLYMHWMCRDGSWTLQDSFKQIPESEAALLFPETEEFFAGDKVDLSRIGTRIRDEVYRLTEADKDPLFGYGTKSGIGLKGNGGTGWKGDWKTMTIDKQGDAATTNGVGGQTGD